MKTEPTNKREEIEKKSSNNLQEYLLGFKELTKNVKSVEANAFGVITINFKDGTSCGGLTPWFEAGILSREEYSDRYSKLFQL